MTPSREHIATSRATTTTISTAPRGCRHGPNGRAPNGSAAPIAAAAASVSVRKIELMRRNRPTLTRIGTACLVRMRTCQVLGEPALTDPTVRSVLSGRGGGKGKDFARRGSGPEK